MKVWVVSDVFVDESRCDSYVFLDKNKAEADFLTRARELAEGVYIRNFTVGQASKALQERCFPYDFDESFSNDFVTIKEMEVQE